MKLKGRLVDISKDILEGGYFIRLAVKEVPTGLDKFREADLALSFAIWREQRSLSANAYYWVLVAKIADSIGQSQNVVHNILLRRYGQMKLIDGEPVTTLLLDTDEAEQAALEDEEQHLKPTSHLKEGKDGRGWRFYRVLKGSSQYDSKEMATLIDGAISEAREMGLETLPAWEIERMIGDYEKHHSNQ